MKHHYYYFIVLFILSFADVWGQSPFFHFDAKKIDQNLTTYYGDGLKPSLDSEDPQASLLINFNPTISFNGIDDYLVLTQSISNISQATVFTIFLSKNKDSIQGNAVWGLHGESSEIALTTKGAFTGDKFAYYLGGDSNQPVLHSYVQMHRTNGSETLDTYISIGATKKESTYPYFKGNIAEIIAYKRVLRGTQRQKIESALALKYGITLDHEKNYISSKKKVVWDRENDTDYSFNIAGIGRDDESNLYQKQSTSSNNPDFLTIGVNSIANSNRENTAVLNDLDFIVWGDNNQFIAPESEESIADRIPLLHRKWLLKTTGNSTYSIITQLKIDTNTLLDSTLTKENFLLVIDKTGNADFLPENCKYIQPTSISEQGIALFDDVIWDEDRSGNDAFSFTVVKDLNLIIESEQPIVCPDSFSSLIYKVSGGVPVYSYKLTNDNATYNKEWKSTDDQSLQNTITNLIVDTYTLEVTDTFGNKASQFYTIAPEDEIAVDLGPDQQLTYEGEITLLPTLSNPESISSYSWTKDGVYFSDEQTISINEAGIYALTVQTNLGCTYFDEITIKESFIREFILYPNPTSDGKYSITVKLAAKSDINVTVYSITGVQLNDITTVEAFTIENKFKANIKGSPISTTGFYEVRLVTPYGSATKKLIVE